MRIRSVAAVGEVLTAESIVAGRENRSGNVVQESGRLGRDVAARGDIACAGEDRGPRNARGRGSGVTCEPFIVRHDQRNVVAAVLLIEMTWLDVTARATVTEIPAVRQRVAVGIRGCAAVECDGAVG